MKILMLNHNIIWEGTFYRCYHFARHLVRRGHRVTILTRDTERRTLAPQMETQDGVQIVKTPRQIGRFPRGYARRWLVPGVLWRFLWVLKERYDAVMAFDHWPEVACPFFLAKWTRGQKLVADWADWWTDGGLFAGLPPGSLGHRVERWLEVHSKHAADSVTVISQALRERALSIGVAPERVHLLPSGADIENIRPLPKGELRRRLGLPLQAPIIAYTGISSAPEVRLLIEAFALIGREVPDAHLLLIGPFQQAKDRADLDAALRARIIAPGVVAYAQLGAYLAAADLLALPLPDTVNSRARWPNKFGDYLAAGRPIVATAFGDLGPIFQDHPVGLAAEPGAASFARQAAQLLGDRDRREACGRAARELAENRLDWSILARQLESILQRN